MSKINLYKALISGLVLCLNYSGINGQNRTLKAAVKGIDSVDETSKTESAAFQYPLYGDAEQLYTNNSPYDLNEEIYTFKTIWSTSVQPDINFLPQSYNSPIVTRGNSTFVFFVDPNHRMKIAKITDDNVEEAFIDNILYQPDEFYANHDGDATNDVTTPDYYRVKYQDSHHSVSMGIDEKGYIHLVGDMHNYPTYEPPQEHLPMRYAYKKMLYWRSDNPLDISSFTFLGDQADKVPQGKGFTYPNFFNDLNGKLYFTSRAQQASNIRCASYSTYDAGTETWSVVGDNVSGEEGHPCLFYEDNGEGETTYNKTHPVGVFDRKNNLHVSAPILNTNDSPVGSIVHFATNVVYLKSTDGGQTFTKADGTPVPVPARVEAGPNQADVVFTAEYLAVMGNIAVDYQNNPYTVAKEKFADGSPANSYILGWNGTSWQNYGILSDAQADFRLVHDPAGMMSYIGDSNGEMMRFWKPDGSVRTVDLPWSIRVVDCEYLKKTGNIMGLAKVGDDMAVVKVEITRPGMQLVTPDPEVVTNHAPVITTAPYFDGSALHVSATDEDGDVLAYTWYSSYGAGNVTFSENDTEAAATTEPAFSADGNYELKVSVSDGTNTTIATVIVQKTTQPNETPDLTKDLYLYWKLDGTAADNSGNERDGTISETVVWATSFNGQAMVGDGLSSIIDYDLPQETTFPSYTVSLWAKSGADGQNANSGLFNNSSSANDFQIDVNGSDGYRYKSDSQNALFGTASTDEWVHLLVRADGYNTELFYNGIKAATMQGEYSGGFGRIGLGSNRPDLRYFNGQLDELRVYNRALSDEEIALIYKQSGNTTGVDIQEKQALLLYPNPAHSFLTVEGVKPGDAINILNLQGIPVLQKIARAGIETIDVSALAKGMYLVHVNQASQKLMVK